MKTISRKNRTILFEPRQRNVNFLLSVVMTTIKMLIIMILMIGIGGAGIVTGVAKAWVDTVPELNLDAIFTQSQTSFIYDKYGNLITEYKGSENRIYAPLEEIPENLIYAIVAQEDSRFFDHNGVDIKRIGGAFLSNFISGTMQGASTITCQLIKLTLLSHEQTYKRKIQEAYLALELEDVMGKDEILEAYLNEIYLGGACYGVKIAAQDYFGKELDQLTLRECACIARIIQNPYKYNPRRNYYVFDSPDDLNMRINNVLKKMYDQGYISYEDYEAAVNDELHVLETSSAAADAMYDNAYYVEFAIYDVITKMLRVEGLDDTSTNRRSMENKLRNGGYRVYTSLDSDVQKSVQDVISSWNGYPEMRYENDTTTRSSLGGGEYLIVQQPQTAAVVMNNATGEVVAVIGGREEPIQKKLFNRAFQSTMPIGSSIKPIAVYGPAFDLGYSPGSPVINMPIRINGWVSELGYPQNFEIDDYNGIETLRMAMTKSHNTAAAHTLYEYVKIQNSVVYLLKLGIDESHILATGSGLALGSSGITMLELTGAFNSIINMGEYQEPCAFTRVLNSDGTVYIDASEVRIKRQVFQESTAWMLIDVMNDCVSQRGTGSRAKWSDISIAGKTGTNSNNIGVTFAGFSAYYTCAVWIGSDYYKPLEANASGGVYAAPLWAAVMQTVHEATGCTENRPLRTKTAASVGLIEASACGISGMKPTEYCYRDTSYPPTKDYYLAGTEPTKACIMHQAHHVLYVPEGHPLLDAVLDGSEDDQRDVLKKFFKRMTTDKD